MIFLYAFLLGGFICAMAELIKIIFKLTVGQVTVIFVIIGTLFGFGNFYDTLIEYCGVGATLPIISFGHSLVDSAIEFAKEEGFIGIFKGIYNTTAPGIAFTIFLSLFLGIFFKPKR